MSVAAGTASGGVGASIRLALGRLIVPGLVRLTLVVLAASLLVALVERDREPMGAPGRALSVVASLFVPLFCFAVVSLATGRARLDDATWPVARYGVPRRTVALALIGVSAGIAALLSLASVVVAMVLAHPGEPGLASDVLTSAWIMALGAAAYAGMFMLGAGFLRLGRGRWIALAFDFLLSGTSGVLAVVGPRAHVESLLGGEPVFALSQPDSSVLLAALAAVFALLAAMRAGR